MNRLRSLLSLRGMLLRYSVGSRAKNLQRARLWSSVYNKLMFALDKNSLKRKNKIDLSKSLICGDFKDLTWFRQNLPFSSSLKKTKEHCLQAGSGWHFPNVHWDFRYRMSLYPVKRIQNHVDQSIKFTAVVLVFNKVEKVVHTISTFQEQKKCREDIIHLMSDPEGNS